MTARPPNPALEPGVVELHLLRLDAAHSERSLAASERSRADQLEGSVRQRFVAARAQLREILAAYLGVAPAEVQLFDDELGKPQVAGTPLRFNLSHSDDVGVVAVAAMPVGVDVEHVRALPDLDALARRVCSATELAALELMPDGARTPAFFRMWTRKEALLKSRGDGLRIDPARVHVGADAMPDAISVDGVGGDHWSLQDVRVGGEYAAAVAVAQASFDVRYADDRPRQDSGSL